MADTGERQFVTLCLGAEVFAVPVTMVREVLDYREPFRVPDGPDFLRGLIDVRGHGAPVIDLRAKLDLPDAEITNATRILVVDVPLADKVLTLGLVADKVLSVVAFDVERIEAAPDIGSPWRSAYIAGVVRQDDGFAILLDLPKLLSAREARSVRASVLET